MKKLLSLCLPVLFLLHCGPKNDDGLSEAQVHTPPAQVQKRTAVLEVQFVEGTKLETEPVAGAWQMEPERDGTLTVEGTTLRFTPLQPLAADTAYSVRLDLSKLVRNGKGNYRFQFSTPARELRFLSGNVSPTEVNGQRGFVWQGQVLSADYEEGSFVRNLVRAEQDSRDLNISWRHNQAGTVHDFQVEGIRAGLENSTVVLIWEGGEAAPDFSGRERLVIPAGDHFGLLDVGRDTQGRGRIELSFTQALNTNQELTGLVHIDQGSLKLEIENNLILAYPRDVPPGSRTLTVEAGIRAVDGRITQETTTHTLTFNEAKPEIFAVGDGHILPNSSELVFPFESVNLSAVDVKISKIPEKNVPYFLQVNALDGSRDEYRFAVPVATRHVPFNEEGEGLGERKRRYLNLAEFIDPEPGALYNIEMRFRKAYSSFTCTETETPSQTQQETVGTQKDLWHYYNDWSNYNYRDTENPCKDSYYLMGRRGIQHNVYASDIGLVAKADEDHRFSIWATDLLTGGTMAGTDIRLFNYQNIQLDQGKTNEAGFIRLQGDEQAFLVIAQRGGERAYLKVSGGDNLTVSRFDVGGGRRSSGMKGYIYSERGVHRPGDPVPLFFVLDRGNNELPEDYPVELTIHDPRGTKIHRQVLTQALGNMYRFDFQTANDAPTGNYHATIRVGDAVFEKPLPIETIVPNRMKIELKTDLDNLVAGKKLNLDLQVNWLTGAPAKDVRTLIEANYYPKATHFKDYNGYDFDDDSRRFSSDWVTVLEKNTNDRGEVQHAVDLFNFVAPGSLRLRYRMRAFEPGGGFSSDFRDFTYHPYHTYVGVSLPTDENNRLLVEKDHDFSFVTVDTQGKPVSGAAVTYALYKLDWRWWWDIEQGKSNFINLQSITPVEEGKAVTDTKGQARFNKRFSRKTWGSYLIRACVDNQHCTSKTFIAEWPGWADSVAGGEDAVLLRTETAKEEYLVGETVDIDLPTPKGGTLLVTRETASGVIHHETVTAQAPVTRYSFTAEQGHSPTLYVWFTLLQPHRNTAGGLPMRMYGITPIRVVDPDSRLEPTITSADHFEPETDYEITVGEANGRPMTYSLAVVDEGLLDITRFRTPQIHDFFFAKEASIVRTWDLYDDVVGAFGGPIQALSAVGGGAEGDKAEDTKPNRFRPVCEVLGPFQIKAGEKKNHQLTMPRYIGSVRIMVVANHENAYGSSDRAVPVKKPLMVLAAPPRVLSIKEHVALPVTVFAGQDGLGPVKVKVTLTGPASLDGSGEQEITMDTVGDQTLFFPVSLGNRVGNLHLQVRAESQSLKATYEADIEVRNPHPPITNSVYREIAPGEQVSFNVALPGIPGTNEGMIELAVIPPLNLQDRLTYLVGYPHGCAEQTISRAFPQLYLAKITDLDEGQKEAVVANVDAAIQKLVGFANQSGALSYWPGYMENSVWLSTYGAHFLSEARDRGFSVPAGLLSNLLTFLGDDVTRKTPQDGYQAFETAYQLYVLALAEMPAWGPMNRLYSTPQKSDMTTWLLAGAYAAAGRPEVAREMITHLPVNRKEQDGYKYNFGSLTRDQGLVLDVLVRLGDQTKSVQVAKAVSSELNSENYLNTHACAMALVGMAHFAEGNGAPWEVSWEQEGQGNRVLRSGTPVGRFAFEPEQVQGQTMSMTNNGSQTVFLNVWQRGKPENPPQTASANQLSLNVQYSDGNNSIQPDQLAQGKDIIAEIEVGNTSNRQLENLALTQIIPAGWQILNEEVDEEKNYIYRDIRDDRVLTYFNLKQGEKKTFKVRLNASYRGRFFLPAVNVEAMYDNKVHAHNRGGWVEVSKP